MSDDTTDDTMDVVLVTQAFSSSPAASTRSIASSVTSPPKPGIQHFPLTQATRSLSPMVADTAINTALATHKSKKTVPSQLTSTGTVQARSTISTLQLPASASAMSISSAPDTDTHADTPSTPPRPSTSHPKVPMDPLTPKALNALRVEVRWAPKDFLTLKASKALMYTRFAPILSGFNTSHSRVIEWQTDQMSQTSIITSTQVNQFLSVRCVASSKQILQLSNSCYWSTIYSGA